MKYLIIGVVATLLVLGGCSSAPRIVVNQSTVTDSAKYDADFEACYTIAKSFDLNDEKALKGIAGAAIGGTAVAGVATAVAGAVLLQPFPSSSLGA